MNSLVIQNTRWLSARHLTTTATLFLLSSGLLAQSALEIEEIVVTAQKREQRLQDVPMSIQAFSGDSMKALNIDALTDLQAHVPSLALNAASNSTTVRIWLRGIGNESFHINAPQPVGVYVDGAFQGNPPVFGMQFMDVERLEVMKGPQGTLWGKNTTAGLINVVTKRPEVGDDVSGYLDMSYGNYNSIIAEGAVNIPMTETLAARIAVRQDIADGQHRIVGPGAIDKNLGDKDQLSARMSIAYEPSEDLNALLSVTYGHVENETRVSHPIAQQAGDFDFFRCDEPTVRNDTGCVAYLGFVPTGDINASQAGHSGIDEQEALGVKLVVDREFGAVTLSSITAFDDADAFVYNDDDGMPFATSNAGYASDFRSFSQEIRLSSNDNSRFGWIAGIYYFEDESDQMETFNSIDTDFLNGTAGNYASFMLQKSENIGAFGELTFALGNRWELITGLRITKDERDVTAEAFALDPNYLFANPNTPITRSIARSNVADVDDVTVFDFETFDIVPFGTNIYIPAGSTSDGSWTEPSGRVSLSYRWDDDGMVYATIARGFNGGIVDAGATQPSDLVPVDPEFLTSIEVGTKLTLADGRFDFNAAVFHYDFTDQHISVENFAAGTIDFQNIVNAGSTTVKGFEFEGVALPTDNFRIRFAFAYLDAKFDEFIDTFVDRSGNELPYSPRIDITVGGEYLWNLTSGATIVANVTGAFEDERFFTVTNDPIIAQTDSYWNVGARLTYTSPSDAWDVALWGRNLLDEEYMTRGWDAMFFGGVIPASIGDRLTYGISAKYRF